MQPLLIRADANTAIGSGHVMRCLALAQAWQEHGGMVTFVSANDLPDSLQTRLTDEKMQAHLLQEEPGSRADVTATINFASDISAETIVVDGYHFGADYQRWIKDAGFQLLFIDDNGHAQHYYADWVLNQNIHATEALYPNREPYTRLLLGTRYVLLRREFWPYRGWQREIPEIAQNVLVTMGGSDPDNVTLKVLEAITQLPEAAILKVRAVIGGSNPHMESLRDFAETSTLELELLQDVNDMPAQMAWADVAISGGGSTSWEMALLGLPRLVIVTAANQLAIAQFLAARGAALNLGWHTSVTPLHIAAPLQRLLYSTSDRFSMSATNHDLVEGEGANRVATTLLANESTSER
jgi:UDP-2,4-diacetamido-2,4,6-trideoxy-beta-L-altropyranose hydrolase